MIGVNVFWLVMGLIYAMGDLDPRVEYLDLPGCHMKFLMGEGRPNLYMEFGSPYTITITATDWEIVTGIMTDERSLTESFKGDMERCVRDLTVLKLALPAYRGRTSA